MKFSPHTLCVLVALALPASVSARTIDWGNAVGDTLVDSHGMALDDSFVFELGSFGSFVPTAANLDQWLANWKPFDRAVAPSDWNSTNSFFSSSATMQDGQLSSETSVAGGGIFAEGEQAYIWAYNRLDYDLATEWALVTNGLSDGSPLNDWTFPIAGGKTDDPLQWRISDASTVIYGGLNDEQGDGYYQVDPGSFALQTHATVPEPSSALLVLLAGIAVRCRRFRKGA